MVTEPQLDASDLILSRKRIYGYSRLAFFNIKKWQYVLIIVIVIGVPLLVLPRQMMIVSHYKNRGMLSEALSAIPETTTTTKPDAMMMRLSADLHREAGNPEKSIEVLESLLEMDPNNPKVLMDLIDLYTGTQNNRKRITALELKIRMNPADTQSLKSLADHYSYQGLLDKYIDTVVRLLEIEKGLPPETVFSYIEDPETIQSIINEPLIRAIGEELQRLAKMRISQNHPLFLDELIRQLYTYRNHVVRKIKKGALPPFPDQAIEVTQALEPYVRAGMLGEGKTFATALDTNWDTGAQNRFRFLQLLCSSNQDAEALAWLRELKADHPDLLFQTAEYALQLEKITTAASIYEKIVEKNPGNSENRLKLADLYLEARDGLKAYNAFKEIALATGACGKAIQKLLQAARFVEKRPIVIEAAGLSRKFCSGQPDTLRTAAEMLLAAGAELSAIEAYTDYLKLKPGDRKAADQLVDLFLWNQKPREAYSVLKQLAGATDPEREILLKMTQAAAGAGDPTLLREAVETSTRLRPRDAVLRIKLGALLTDSGLYPEAARIYRNHLEQVPGDDRALAQLKQLYQWTNQPERAAELSAESSDRDQGNFQKALTAGVEYMEAGKTGKAIFYFERASRIQPRHVPVRKRLADCYVWAGNTDQMILQLEFLDQIGEIESRQKQLLARTYLDKRQSRLALKHMKPMERQPALSVELGLMLAEAYTLSEQRVEAIRIYKRIGREHPHNAELLARVGREVLWLQDSDSALDLFKAALNIEPNNRIALKGGGNAYVLKHDLHKAIRQLETYNRLFPDDYEVRFQLGELYFGTGQQHRAYKHYGRALALIRKAKRSTPGDGNQPRVN